MMNYSSPSEKEFARLVAREYPPLAQGIQNFSRQVHTTPIKGQGSRVCERLAPAIWRFKGTAARGG